MSLSTAELIVIVVVVVVVVIGTVIVCTYCWKALATISIEATKQGQSFSHTFRSSLRQGFRRFSNRSHRHDRAHSTDTNPNIASPTATALNTAEEPNHLVPKRTNSGTQLREFPPSYDEALNHKLVRERQSNLSNVHSGSYHGVDVNIVNADLDVLTGRPTVERTNGFHNTHLATAQYLPISDSLLINPAFFLGAQTQTVAASNNGHSLPSSTAHSLSSNTAHSLPSSLQTNSAQAPAPPQNAQSPPYRERYIGDATDEGGFLKAQEKQQKSKHSPPRNLRGPPNELQRSESQSQLDALSSKGSVTNSDTMARRQSEHTYTQFLQTATKLFQHHLSRQNLDSSGEDDMVASVASASSGYKTQDTHSCNGLPESHVHPHAHVDGGYHNPLYRSEGQLNLSSNFQSDSERSYCLTAIPRRHSDRLQDRISVELDHSVVVFPDEDREHILTETYI